MKKNIFGQLLAVFSLVFLFSAASGQSGDDIKAKITKINHEMAQAMMEGNIEKSLVYYADDAISMPNGSKMLEGIDAIRKSSQEMAASGMKVKSFETQTIYASPCENMIAEVGKFKISFTVPGVPDAISEEGKYLTIWQIQDDGSLKIKLETWNSDTNPMANSSMSEVQ